MNRSHFLLVCSVAVAGLVPAERSLGQDPGSAVEPAPAAEPARAPAPPPPAPPDKRLEALETELARALARDPLVASELESVCTAWRPRRVLELEPTLAARLKLCAGRAAALAGRLEQAEDRLHDAAELAAAPPPDELAAARMRAVQAEAVFRIAELRAEELRGYERCGTGLGLARLRVYEDRARTQLLERASGAYQDVVEVGDPAWSRQATYRIASMHAEVYRAVAYTPPTTYRGLPLPSPFAIDRVHSSALLGGVLAPDAAGWPMEIARLLREAEQDARRAGDDKLAAKLAAEHQELRDLGPLPGEQLENPWLADLEVGFVRFDGHRFVERRDNGAWVKLPEDEAKSRLKSQLREGVGSAAHAYALVALAESGAKVSSRRIEEAIVHADPRVKLAGLRAAEVAPRARLLDVLRAAAAEALAPTEGSAPDPDAYDKRFSTLQSALYGVPERALLALRALVDKERTLAVKASHFSNLPLDERAWLVAELEDARVQYRYQELIGAGDARTASNALYGLHGAVGPRSVWMLRQVTRDLPGCVSAHLQALEAERSSR